MFSFAVSFFLGCQYALTIKERGVFLYLSILFWPIACEGDAMNNFPVRVRSYTKLFYFLDRTHRKRKWLNKIVFFYHYYFVLILSLCICIFSSMTIVRLVKSETDFFFLLRTFCIIKNVFLMTLIGALIRNKISIKRLYVKKN